MELFYTIVSLIGIVSIIIGLGSLCGLNDDTGKKFIRYTLCLIIGISITTYGLYNLKTHDTLDYNIVIRLQ